LRVIHPEKKGAEIRSDAEIKSKENQIQHLKDRCRVQQDTITSLKNQIKMLKDKQKK
jgi:predicted RNase H-like nuclease (RuvC/YqgF family)